MITKPLLSICIPTYARSGYLKRCLESILIQLDNEKLMDLVEVVISDNCSPDDTETIARKYKNSFKHFIYSRNEKNVGFDLNILNVVTSATGTYCWYLGDDDVVVNGAIRFVCEKLATNKYDIVCVEAEHVTPDDQYKNLYTYDDSKTISLSDGNEYYFQGLCQGGLSVLLFDRELWMKHVGPKDFLRDWLYYETVLKILATSQKEKLYIQEACIQTGQDCRWAENGGELFTFINSNILLKRMITFGFDEKKLTSALRTNGKKIITIILRAKGHDLRCSFKNLKYIYTHAIGVNTAHLALVTLFYFVPNPIIRFLRDTRKALSSTYNK